MAWPWSASASCDIDADSLYEQFKTYRRHINNANSLSELAPYFSTSFNQYYRNKLQSTTDQSASRRYLTQYWDNLNTAKDVVVVYDYSMRCRDSTAILELVAVLSPEKYDTGNKVDLWGIKIHYINENKNWVINSFEFEILNNGNNGTEIVNGTTDNFFSFQ
jgi:hypothetical protein